jgi:hypothetical protein
MEYSRETILSTIRIYATKIEYQKLNGENKLYIAKSHPLSDALKHLNDLTKPEATEDRIPIWDVRECKWRFIRPEGVKSINTDM